MSGEDFLGGAVRLYHGDSRDVLKTLPDASVDSVVTDPPYALVSIVKRFGPAGAAPATPQEGSAGAYARASAGFMGKQWDTGETAFAVEFWAEVMRVLKPGGHVIAFSGTRTYHRLAVAIEDAGFEIRDMLQWLYGSGFPKSHDVAKAIDKGAGVDFTSTPAEGVGFMGADGPGGYNPTKNQLKRVGESTPEAQQWEGWGTALKPACEPIVMARKPLGEKSVARNVLAHGTGGIHVDACRVELDAGANLGAVQRSQTPQGGHTVTLNIPGHEQVTYNQKGRWPANVLHDGSPEATAPFGDAARFFYSAKADAMDRAGSKHPTVKPVDLMQWCCRLVTPPGGVVLDPFAGSGSTGEAAFREGFRAILVEREAEYAQDIRERLALADGGEKSRRRAIAKRKAGDEDLGGLFGGAA